MTARRTRKIQSLIRKSSELSLAAPQVVAHRLTRMAMAGRSPSKRDQKEFRGMVAEKSRAFGESWNAMFFHGVRVNQALATSMIRSFWSPSATRNASPRAAIATFQAASLGMLDKALAPVHRKAVANARRLVRTKPR